LALALAVLVAGWAAVHQIRKRPRMMRGPVFGKCLFASPQLARVGERDRILVAVADGTIATIDPQTNEIVWRYVIEAPYAEQVWLLATPVTVEGRIVVAYLTYSVLTAEPTSQRVIVLDQQSGRLDSDFRPLELAAKAPAFDGEASIDFDPTLALSRAALVHAGGGGGSLGYVYVSFGHLNTSKKPYHGWVFELDLDAWRKGEAAVSAVLPTTRDPDCPADSPSPNSLCGGGVWAPRGPKLRASSSGDEILVPTGNGAFDLARQEYSVTLMRLGRGLRFDPGCDPQLCAGGSAARPTDACAASCANLFIPRLLPGEPPVSGCGDRGFHECLAERDLDFGSSPVEVDLPDGRSVLVQAGKDGALYLIDPGHLGTLYDRKQIVAACGTDEEPCESPAAGTIVTEPAVTEVDGTPVVIVPTFVSDHVHPAGVVAVKIVVRDGVPKIEPFWRAPAPDSREAVENFRQPPSGITLTTNRHGHRYAWVADYFSLWAFDVRDGRIAANVALDLRSIRYARPLAHEGRLYVALCRRDDRGSRLDSYPYGDVGD
jgi:hypothetical protein